MENKKIDFDKLIKGILVFSLLLVALSVSYYYVFFLPQKEKARLEQQEQEQLAKLEQEQKEYIAKRKMECYEIYENEREKFSNLKSYRYIDICSDDANDFTNLPIIKDGIITIPPLCQDDSCEIIYNNPETETTFRKYF